MSSFHSRTQRCSAQPPRVRELTSKIFLCHLRTLMMTQNLEVSYTSNVVWLKELIKLVLSIILLLYLVFVSTVAIATMTQMSLRLLTSRGVTWIHMINRDCIVCNKRTKTCFQSCTQFFNKRDASVKHTLGCLWYVLQKIRRH